MRTWVRALAIEHSFRIALLRRPGPTVVGGFPLAYLLMAASLLLVFAWLLFRRRGDRRTCWLDDVAERSSCSSRLAFVFSDEPPGDLIYVGNFT